MTILIAEDDTGSSSTLRETLAQTRANVIGAVNGEEALRLIQERSEIRILICDWTIPGIDGLELCRRVRAMTDRPYVYILLLASCGERDHRLTSLEAGADDYACKPVDPSELLARVNVARRLIAVQDELRNRTEELEHLHAELKRQNVQLAELATSDGLTGLKNLRYFQASLESAVSFSNRKGFPLSLIMLDVDHFKEYNDTFGHPAGDQVLIRVAQILRDNVREHDVVARYGGEEFVLLLPATDVDDGLLIAERLRVSIEAEEWPLRPIRASFGVATTNSKVRATNQLVELADRALYLAKARGRNQTAEADELENADPTILTFPHPHE